MYSTNETIDIAFWRLNAAVCERLLIRIIEHCDDGEWRVDGVHRRNLDPRTALSLYPTHSVCYAARALRRQDVEVPRVLIHMTQMLDRSWSVVVDFRLSEYPAQQRPMLKAHLRRLVSVLIDGLDIAEYAVGLESDSTGPSQRRTEVLFDASGDGELHISAEGAELR